MVVAVESTVVVMITVAGDGHFAVKLVSSIVEVLVWLLVTGLVIVLTVVAHVFLKCF